MWGIKPYIILLTLILQFNAYSQQKPTRIWGITYSPGFSGGKYPSGVGSGYTPWLTISEPTSFSNHISVFNRKRGAWLTHQREVGFSNFTYSDKFYWETIPDLAYLNGKRSLNFIEMNYTISKGIKMKSVVISPEVGLIGAYFLSGKYEFTHKYFTEIYNGTSKMREGKFNYGFSAGLKIGIPLSTKFSLEFGPVYKHLLKKYNFPGEKVLYFWGLDVSFIYHR